MTENKKKQAKKVYKKPSPAVLRRRRLAAFLILVLIVGLVVVIISAGVGLVSNRQAVRNSTEENSTALPQVQEAISSNPSTSSSSDAEEKCDSSQVIVTAQSDSKVYSKQKAPKISASIENQNSFACSVNLGTKALEYTAVQGKQQIFSSQDCLTGDVTDLKRNIAPGATVKIEDFVWQRTLTQPNCPSSNTIPNRAPIGEYAFVVQVGDYKSKPINFTLQ